jgi:hypothetical protein
MKSDSIEASWMVLMRTLGRPHSLATIAVQCLNKDCKGIQVTMYHPLAIASNNSVPLGEQSRPWRSLKSPLEFTTVQYKSVDFRGQGLAGTNRLAIVRSILRLTLRIEPNRFVPIVL